jgi:hypothetical protein
VQEEVQRYYEDRMKALVEVADLEPLPRIARRELEYAFSRPRGQVRQG